MGVDDGANTIVYGYTSLCVVHNH